MQVKLIHIFRIHKMIALISRSTVYNLKVKKNNTMGFEMLVSVTSD